ncbi:hypothetical protein LF1_22310 [Rubripirellula obstinata]|uniref:Uncharacterized protein n=1 Tax=Rubripirellula obstinata TaxID=406547 RepID=A0A5B1CK40_9BACT|nr:hypothetical protein [Rubripirellula obstinata]KAA1259694.1 hypothetical protein LF1_22310 [Rubripirellula obstinata]
MNLDLPPSTEEVLREQAFALGMSLEEFTVKTLTEMAKTATPVSKPHRDHKTWMNDVREWSESHPDTSHFVDDSRDSIYEDRGL